MNKIIAPLVALALVTVAGAIDIKVLTCTTHSQTASVPVTASTSVIRGHIESVTFDVVTAGTTGDISVATTSDISTALGVTLATKADCDADTVFYPRYLSTDNTGAQLGTNAPERFGICGETITMTVTNASKTNVQFRAIIKYDK